MKKRVVFWVVFWGVLIGDRCLSDQNPYKTDMMNNGRGWKDWERVHENRAEFMKLVYLNGVFDAMRMAYLKSDKEECANEIRDMVRHAFKVRYADMIDGINAAIKDRRNEQLPLPFLWQLVCQRLSGSISEEEYKKQLSDMRGRYSQDRD